MTRREGTSQLARFACVGAVGTAAYVVLFLLLRGALGAQGAGLAARVLLAVPTTWLNGRWTFDRRVSRLRLNVGALATVSVGMLVTAALLGLEQELVPGQHRPAEILALVLANGASAVARFVVLRRWVFARARTVAAA